MSLARLEIETEVWTLIFSLFFFKSYKTMPVYAIVIIVVVVILHTDIFC